MPQDGDTPLFDRIRDRAFYIWEEEGRPLGRDDVHWARAEMEILRGLPDADPETRQHFDNPDAQESAQSGDRPTDWPEAEESAEEETEESEEGG